MVQAKNDEKKNLLIIGAILLILLVVGINKGWIKFPFASVPDTCYGGASMLISEGSIRQTGENIFKKIFFVRATAGVGTECAVISWDSALLNGKLPSDSSEKTTKGIYGNFFVDQETQTFKASKENQVNRVAVYGTSALDNPFCTVSKCKEILNSKNIAWSNVLYARSSIINCYCGYEYKFGDSGVWDSGFDRDYGARFCVTGIGCENFNKNHQEGYVNGDPRVYVTFLGGLNSFKFLGQPTQKAFLVSGEQVRIVNSDAYSKYISLDKNALANCVTESCFADKASNFNIAIDEYFSDKTDEWANSNGVLSYSKEGDRLTVFLPPTTTVKPEFNVEIDATFVGLEYVCGTPKVTCPTETQIIEPRQQKNIGLKVKNTATTPGSFSLSLTCPTEIGGTLNIYNVNNMAFNQENPIIATLTAFTTSNINKKCIFKAYIERCNKESTCDINILAKASSCTPLGGTICRKGNTEVAKCMNSGEWQTIETCSIDKVCTIINNVAQCGSTQQCINTQQCIDKYGIDYVCEKNKCIQQTQKCQSCTDWAKNLFRSKENKCEPTGFLEQGSWWNPLNWALNPVKWVANTSGLTSQNVMCPIIFGVGGIFLIIILIIILIILAFLGISFVIVSKIFRAIGRLFKKK